MLKDKAKISVAVDTLDVDNSINIQDNKENINSYAEWLAASAAHDAFYAPHPQGGLYKRDMNAIQFLYIIASSDRDFICRIMDGMRSAPIGTGVTGGTLRTFVFVVDFSKPQNSDFGLFLAEQAEENIKARVLTEFIIVDYQRGVYYKVGGGRVQDRDLKKVLDKTSVAVKMKPEKRKELTAAKKTAAKRTLSDIRPKKGNAGLLSPVFVIVFINALVFIIDFIFMAKTGEKPLEEMGIQYNKLIWEGEWWRLLTSVFLHDDLSHIGGNMVMLILISRILRNFYSDLQYWIIYLTTGIMGSLMTLFCMGKEVMSLGASGAVMGMGGVLCFRMFFGENAGYFRKAANCITIGAVVIYNLVVGLTVTEINNWAHFSGFITGFIMAWVFHILQRNKQKNNNKFSA